MACQYIKQCPSATGWCKGSSNKPAVNCLAYVLTAYENLKDREAMTGNEYQKLAERTMNTTKSKNELEMHALHGMVGEIGEIHSLYQKIYQGHNLNETHIKKELGDLLWFIAEYCTVKGWDLEDVMRMNIKKLEDRYPNGFEADRSLHRVEGDI